MSTCPLHPDGSPTRPEWDDDQCVTCFRLAGGVMPTAPRVPPARQPLPVCPHLDPAEVRIGQRTWRRCLAGHGSTHPAAAGLVCRCGTPDHGGLVWRQGHECGPTCPGWSAATPG